MPFTTNYNFELPVVGGSADQWGTLVNAAFDSVDSNLKITADAIAAKASKAAPVFTGVAKFASITTTGTVTSTGGFVGNLDGVASRTTRLATARDISATGPVTIAAVSFDGSANAALLTAVGDAALTIAMTDGLQAALDSKEATLADAQKRVITYGTAAVGSTLAEGEIYFQHEA